MDEIYLKVKHHLISCPCIDCARLDMGYVSKELLEDSRDENITRIYEKITYGNTVTMKDEISPIRLAAFLADKGL